MDHSIDVPIMRSSIFRIGRNEACRLRGLYPATIQACDVFRADKLGLSRGCVHQEDLDDVALAVGFTDQDLALRSPDNFDDDSVIVSEVFWHLN